jgi:hypothetical protein
MVKVIVLIHGGSNSYVSSQFILKYHSTKEVEPINNDLEMRNWGYDGWIFNPKTSKWYFDIWKVTRIFKWKVPYYGLNTLYKKTSPTPSLVLDYLRGIHVFWNQNLTIHFSKEKGSLFSTEVYDWIYIQEEFPMTRIVLMTNNTCIISKIKSHKRKMKCKYVWREYIFHVDSWIHRQHKM